MAKQGFGIVAIVGSLIVSIIAFAAPAQASDSAPLPPHAVMAVITDSGAVELTWQRPLDDGGQPILGYNVYRADDLGPAVQIGGTPDVGFIDNDPDVQERVVRYFVTAYNIIAESIESNPAFPLPGTHCTVILWKADNLTRPSDLDVDVEPRPECILGP